MNKILTTSLGALAVAGLVGGGTFASWSDFSTFGNNNTAAGHLVLDASGGEINNVLSGSPIAPGEYRTIDFFLTSADLAGVPSAALSMSIKELVDIDNGCSSASEADVDGGNANNVDDDVANCDADDGEFSEEAYVNVRWSDPVQGAHFGSGNKCLDENDVAVPIGANGVLTDLQTLATTPLDMADLTGGDGICVRIDLGLTFADATDASQGDESTFDLRFDLDQNA